jgi:hypothetical protein
MKYQIDLCCGKHIGAKPLGDHDRVPIGSSIDFKSSRLTHITLAKPDDLPQSFQQDSGTADFFLLFGITTPEKEFAKEHGGDELLALLRSQTEFPITNPAREPIKA